MTFDKIEWQRQYREKKRKEKESKEEPEKVDPEVNADPELSMEEPKEPIKEATKEESKEEPEKRKYTKKIKEDIAKPPKPKKGKHQMVQLNPEAFAKFSIGIEKTTLQFHKNKELTGAEEQFIETSAMQVAELYEVPKLVIVIQYIASMTLPHATRLMNAHAEKIELENEEKKLDLEEKKQKVEQGREKVKPSDVYQSVMGNKNED